MKLPRRQFLHLAAGAAALPVTSRAAGAHDGGRRDGEERTGQRFSVYGTPAGGREYIKAITCCANEVIERREKGGSK